MFSEQQYREAGYKLLTYRQAAKVLGVVKEDFIEFTKSGAIRPVLIPPLTEGRNPRVRVRDADVYKLKGKLDKIAWAEGQRKAERLRKVDEEHKKKLRGLRATISWMLR